jgi:hypothetical protein
MTETMDLDVELERSSILDGDGDGGMSTVWRDFPFNMCEMGDSTELG